MIEKIYSKLFLNLKKIYSKYSRKKSIQKIYSKLILNLKKFTSKIFLNIKNVSKYNKLICKKNNLMKIY